MSLTDSVIGDVTHGEVGHDGNISTVDISRRCKPDLSPLPAVPDLSASH